MERKLVPCVIMKTYRRFLQKFSECIICDSERSSKRYYDNIDRISNQRKMCCEKNRDKLLPKQDDRDTKL